MNTKTNNDQHLENMLTIKTTVETCMDIQYISCGVGEGIDMSEQKQRFKHALDVLLDGVSLSTSESKRGKVGVYILGLLIKDNPDLVDASDVKAIQSIIEIADEQESPAFRL
ncbi:hypothetical protein [Vibrio aestuarianus]|uniref:hypothetical protein n=1 Tax=Vibrio aestuarianus TaxID=28171 RepID=UPI0020CEEA9E|nr:hypothetical protein [Vibrio aestuarianus]MDE1235791.1 hypothetical protein [Vibrio aestuarianus]MDE1246653.1 hypothetical protein [Vibrio aestuarianus]